MVCHQRRAGFVLGATTRQLNRSYTHGENNATVNQLQAFSRIGLFAKPLPKSLPAFPNWQTQTGSLDERARAYLHINCATCHTPPGYTKIDLRFQTPLQSMRLLGQKPEKPRIGPADSRLIAAGDPHRSELFLRLARRGPGQMPNLATSLVDERAKAVIDKWIRSLSKSRKSSALSKRIDGPTAPRFKK